jgi:hypothetical protein
MIKKRHEPVWSLIPVIPATKEAKIGRSWFKASLGKKFMKPYLKE